MPPKRKIRRKTLVKEDSDSEENIPLKKLATGCKKKFDLIKHKNGNESSSESDIEQYLQPADKLDLKSSFFQPIQQQNTRFNDIENKIYAGVTRLSDSSSCDEEMEENKIQSNVLQTVDKNGVDKSLCETNIVTKMTFKQMEDYTMRIEEAKLFVERYKAKKQLEENKTDISNLLAAGEQKTGLEQLTLPEDLHSSDFESCDSEHETWEEIKTIDTANTEKDLVPKKDIQITVSTMSDIRKKKGVDLLAVMKRRLNRIRKENQIFVHKVHILCWIAHGNYVNGCINKPEVLGVALSLLPSEHCYPSNRTDLSYLEQILNWYKRTVQLVNKPLKEEFDLSKGLELQMSRKIAYNKKMLVYIFVSILRSLGIRCRLVLSFQVEPLRPPISELHSLSTKPPMCKQNTSTHKDKEKHISLNNSKSTVQLAQKNAKRLNLEKLKIEHNRNNVTLEHSKQTPQDMTLSAKKQTEKKSTKKNTEKVVKENDKIDKIKVKKVCSRQNKKQMAEITRAKNGESETVANRIQNMVEKKVSDKKNKKKSEKPVTQTTKDSSVSTEKPMKEIIKIKLPKIDKKEKTREKVKNVKIPQLDGLHTSSSEDEISPNILQIDGGNDERSTKKLNLKKLKQKSESTCPREKRLTASESPRSPFTKKNEDSSITTQNRKLNFHKLINEKSASSSNTAMPSTSKPKMDVRGDIINLIKGRMVEQKHIDRSRMVKKRKVDTYKNDSDSDYAPEPIKKKHHDSEDEFMPKFKVKKRIPVKKTETGLKVLSSSSEEEKKKKGNDIWAEVFLEAEEKWISVDVIYGQVHCIKELYNRATHPVCYVVAWDNNNYLKDVTKRYCLNFSTVTRKLRAEPKWWEETILPFKGPKTAVDKEEDDDLARQQLDQPLPKSIAEYKNHPLYVLKRHLLKFEGIYPADAPTLGFIRGEAVYPRECVYTLHSRDIWLKSAKVVKLGEKPYKIVKARPKYDKLSNSMITDQLLEIFGPWQTEDYVPPTAENGKVPRNAFGNVELFKACMLPKGTVHLKLPGLNKIARRMDIDCASAIVGFDFHGGWSHPTYDGFVVCEEFQDQLIIAWELEQEEVEKREREKIEKRVYTNWKKLIRGLLIRERLKAKYDFGKTSNDTEKKKKSKGPRFCTKKY